MGFWSSVGNAIGKGVGFVSNVARKVGEIGGAVARKVGQFAPAVGSAVGGLVGAINPMLGSAISSAGQFVGNIAQPVGEVMGAIKGVGTMGSKLAGALQNRTPQQGSTG